VEGDLVGDVLGVAPELHVRKDVSDEGQIYGKAIGPT